MKVIRKPKVKFKQVLEPKEPPNMRKYRRKYKTIKKPECWQLATRTFGLPITPLDEEYDMSEEWQDKRKAEQIVAVKPLGSGLNLKLIKKNGTEENFFLQKIRDYSTIEIMRIMSLLNQDCIKNDHTKKHLKLDMAMFIQHRFEKEEEDLKKTEKRLKELKEMDRILDELKAQGIPMLS